MSENMIHFRYPLKWLTVCGQTPSEAWTMVSMAHCWPKVTCTQCLAVSLRHRLQRLSVSEAGQNALPAVRLTPGEFLRDLSGYAAAQRAGCDPSAVRRIVELEDVSGTLKGVITS